MLVPSWTYSIVTPVVQKFWEIFQTLICIQIWMAILQYSKYCMRKQYVIYGITFISVSSIWSLAIRGSLYECFISSHNHFLIHARESLAICFVHFLIDLNSAVFVTYLCWHMCLQKRHIWIHMAHIIWGLWYGDFQTSSIFYEWKRI